jgi:pimeloyl-ACP methyl ester carboxylesterase
VSAARATEVIFLPGFDGDAELRAPFVEAIGSQHPARAVGYPNRKLETLSGYARFAAGHVTPGSRPVLVAESFSGLVAARWAAQDPQVAGLVLCGAFTRSPVPWASLGAWLPSMAQFVGANFLSPVAFSYRDPARRRWSEALAKSIRTLDRDVIAERLRLIAAEDVGAELRQLRIPIVLAHFEDDLVIGARARAALEAVCHNAQVLRMKGPHYAIEVRPRESAAALREALAAMFGTTSATPADS